MKISEFAKITGLPASTIRFYEKHGILKSSRDKNGIRIFNDNDIKWVQFIKRLKETGMSLENIAEYAKLRYEGDRTMNERLNILQTHRKYVLNRINLWEKNLNNLDAKIAFYEENIKDMTKI